MLAEVRDLEKIVCHYKYLILRIESAKRPGASMALVEHVVVVLSGCVMTFSEFEELLDGLNTDGDLGVVD